jgi:flagellar protein FlaG
MTIAADNMNLLNAIVSGSAAAKTAVSEANAQDVKKSTSAPTAEDVQSAVEQLRSYVKSANRAVEFKIDSTTGMTVVTVTDQNSGEVIRQIPSVEALWLAAHIGSKQAALLDTSA